MINEQRSKGLIAPRRRTDNEEPAGDPLAGGGVPVISRLPSLSVREPSLASDTLREPRPADENQTECRTEMAPPAEPMAAPEEVERDLSLDAADDVLERPGKKLLASITTFPWNNLLVCVGFAGLFVLALVAVSRPRPTAIAPLTTPTVHYHIMPPQQAVPQMAETATLAEPSGRPTNSTLVQREAVHQETVHQETLSSDLTRRIARRDIDPVTASTSPGASSSDEAPEQSIVGDEVQARLDIVSASSDLEEYPSTEFPDLPLPAPPEICEPTTSTARLNGNIEKFKK